MTEEQLEILRQELLLALYQAMTDQEAADELNDPDKVIVVPFVSGRLLIQQLILTEYNSRNALQQNTLRAMFPLEDIPIEEGFFRDFLLDTFPPGTNTRVNLLAKFTRTGSRAEQLKLPFLGAHHVALARAA